MRLKIDPLNPQTEIINQAVEVLRNDCVIIYPTDTIYGLGCRLGSPKAIAKIYQLKKRERRKPLSFICHDLKQVSQYAVLTNQVFRLAKRLLPGPYTLVLTASRLAPKVIQSAKQAVGIRIPNHEVTKQLVAALGEPLISTSANLSGEDSLSNPKELEEIFGNRVDMILDAGILHGDPSTVLDCSSEDIKLLRQGAGVWPA